MTGFWKGRKPTDPRGLKNPDVVMARLESGMPLKDAVNRSYDGYYSHCKLHPEWAAKAKALAERNAEAGNRRRGEKKRNQTHCKFGHPLFGPNLLVESKTKFRRCRICMARRAAAPRPATEDQIRRVTEAIHAGQRAYEFSGSGKRARERILGQNKLLLLRQTNPEFDQLYRSKILIRRPWILRRTQVTEIVLTPERIEFNQIADLVPRYLPHDVRDDVIQMIFLAMAEGSLHRDQVPARVRQFISAHYKDARLHSVGKYGLRSLNAPIYGDSTLTLADKVNRVIWDEVPL